MPAYCPPTKVQSLVPLYSILITDSITPTLLHVRRATARELSEDFEPRFCRPRDNSQRLQLCPNALRPLRHLLQGVVVGEGLILACRRGAKATGLGGVLEIDTVCWEYGVGWQSDWLADLDEAPRSARLASGLRQPSRARPCLLLGWSPAVCLVPRACMNSYSLYKYTERVCFKRWVETTGL